MESRNLGTSECMILIGILYEYLCSEPNDAVNAYVAAVREHIPTFDPEALPVWLEYSYTDNLQNNIETFANQFYRVLAIDPMRFLIPILEQCIRTKKKHTLISQIDRIQKQIDFLDGLHLIQ